MTITSILPVTTPAPSGVAIRRRHEPAQLGAVRSSRLFRDVDPAVVGLVAMNADILTVPAGRSLSTAGRMAHQVTIVLDGFVEVTDAAGITTVAGAGTEIGARSIAERRPTDEAVATCTDTTVLVIYGPTFAWALTAAPVVATRVASHPVTAATAAVPASAVTGVASSAVGSTVFAVRPRMVPA